MVNVQGFIGFPVMQGGDEYDPAELEASDPRIREQRGGDEGEPRQRRDREEPEERRRRRGLNLLDILFLLIAAFLAALDTLVILASFGMTLPSSNWVPWIVALVIALIFFIIYRDTRIDGILLATVFIFVFGYLALGPYSGFFRPMGEQLGSSMGLMVNPIRDAIDNIWCLFSNPIECMKKWEKKNVKSEVPVSVPKGVEVTSISALPNIVPACDEFSVVAVIQNQGYLDANDVKISGSCGKYCSANLEPIKYKDKLMVGEGDIVTMKPFLGKALQGYEADTHDTKATININYTYSTNSSLTVDIINPDEMNRLIYELKDIQKVIRPVVAVGKATPAQLSLNVGPQPLKADYGAALLVSVINTRSDGDVILKGGDKIIIRKIGDIGKLSVRGTGTQVDCNDSKTEGNNLITCTIKNDRRIKGSSYNDIFYFTFDLNTTGDVNLTKTGRITAELPRYTFELKKSVSIQINAPIGIMEGFKPPPGCLVSSSKATTTTTTTTTSTTVSAAGTCEFYHYSTTNTGSCPTVYIEDLKCYNCVVGDPGPPPCAFYGTVQVNGQNVADGTLITAIIGDEKYTTTTPYPVYGDSTYRILIVQPSGKNYNGQTVHFMVGSDTAIQTSVWELGGNVLVDLTSS